MSEKLLLLLSGACFTRLSPSLPTTTALPVLFLHYYLPTPPRRVSFHPLPAPQQEGVWGATKGSYFWSRVKEDGEHKVIDTSVV